MLYGPFSPYRTPCLWFSCRSLRWTSTVRANKVNIICADNTPDFTGIIFAVANGEQEFGLCYVAKKPRYISAVWACMFGFDLFTALLAVSNALDQPHRHRIEVVHRLQRDGAALFTVCSISIKRLVHLRKTFSSFLSVCQRNTVSS